MGSPAGWGQIDDAESVRAIHAALDMGVLAWIWAASPRTVPIPGFKTVNQVQDNAGAMAFGPLTGEQMAQIDTILSARLKTTATGLDVSKPVARCVCWSK